MSQPVKMAVGGAISMVAVAIPAVVGVGYYLGLIEAIAFIYGVGVGLVIFASIAFAVTMVFGPSTEIRRLIGVGIYFGRLIFAAAAILVPIVEGILPTVPVVCGLVGVYIVENVVLLVVAAKTAGSPSLGKSRTEG